jgi:hypothetical protein
MGGDRGGRSALDDDRHVLIGQEIVHSPVNSWRRFQCLGQPGRPLNILVKQGDDARVFNRPARNGQGDLAAHRTAAEQADAYAFTFMG